MIIHTKKFVDEVRLQHLVLKMVFNNDFFTFVRASQILNQFSTSTILKNRLFLIRPTYYFFN